MPNNPPRPRPVPPNKSDVRLVSESRRPPLPEHPDAKPYPVNLPFEAYKHLLSGRPHVRPPRPYQRPTGEPETGA